MNDNVENLLLEHVKAIRADLGDLRREVREVKSRLASLEGQVVQMHKSVAFIHEDLAGMNARIVSPKIPSASASLCRCPGRE